MIREELCCSNVDVPHREERSCDETSLFGEEVVDRCGCFLWREGEERESGRDAREDGGKG